MDPMPPPEPVAPKQELFPTSRGAVDQALEQIRANPIKQFDEGLVSLNTEDHISFELLEGLQNLYPQNQLAVTEGFLWSRKVIKEQAASVGLEVPVLTKDGRMSYLISQRENARSGRKLNETTIAQLERIEAEDPEMARALREISQYRVENNHFLFGAVSVYNVLKRMHEAEKLAGDLKF